MRSLIPSLESVHHHTLQLNSLLGKPLLLPYTAQETPLSLRAQLLHLPVICFLPDSLRIWICGEIGDNLC